jgi:phosphate transport system permease protein
MAVALTPGSPHTLPAEDDVPRRIFAKPSNSDKIFRGILRGAGLAVLLITVLILVFLILRSLSAFKRAGFGFFTTQNFFPETSNQFGIAALLPDSALIAVIALLVAVPVGVATAIYISEYAPHGLRRPLIAVIDLMAAIPSVVYALWGFFFLMPRILGTDRWLAQHLGFIPFFHFTKPNSIGFYVGAMFIAGLVVSLMVIPIITSIARQVFSQAPQGEREAAYALGSTRWGMVRTVVLPFGRGGIIGASMLGLGRALGETIAVTFILTPLTYAFSIHVLEGGGNSITAEIANFYQQYDTKGVAALLACGLVLFVATLILNSFASVVISRSRSGAATEAD